MACSLACGSSPAGMNRKSRIVILLGPPGSGRATMVEWFVKKYSYIPIRECQVVQKAISDKQNRFHRIATNLGGKIFHSLDRKLLAQIIRNEMQQAPKNAKFIMDNFPKDIMEMVSFKQCLEDVVDIEMVIFLNCCPELCATRALSPLYPDEGVPESRLGKFHQLVNVYFTNVTFMHQLIAPNCKGFVEIDASSSPDATWDALQEAYENITLPD